MRMKTINPPAPKMALNSRRLTISITSGLMLRTARTSCHAKDKHGMPVSNCIASGNLAHRSPLNWLSSELVWKVPSSIEQKRGP